MTWDVTITVLVSVFGSIVLVLAVYFIHVHLIPHLKQPKGMPDITLPKSQRRTNHRLQASLYSLPSLNYIDPRNSIADSDLRSSRWSTNPQDLSPSTPPMSLSLSQSPRMYFRTPSCQSTISPVHKRNMVASTDSERASEITPTIPYNLLQAHAEGRKRRARPPALMLATEKGETDNTSVRARSKSDSVVPIQRGLLAHSHAVLYGHVRLSELASPTVSNFSGTTLHSSPATLQ